VRGLFRLVGSARDREHAWGGGRGRCGSAAGRWVLMPEDPAMSTHLRLHQDVESYEALSAARGLEGADDPVTYRFPEAMASARRCLVAGVVQVAATPEPARDPTRRGGSCGVVARIQAGGGLVREPEGDRLLRGVERTLDEMQRKLDVLREDAEDAFKFPVMQDEGPRAA
jgi:hypothetical protein